ncbi:MAG: hypothetical protein IT567_00845 [Alphaproteobacteria bacterium]|nr:hypothetical protein [Alphaproteobacteria bacterium]
MVPGITAPYIQTPPPVSDAVITGLTDAAIGRLPATIVAPAVPASSADLQLHNNTQSTPKPVPAQIGGGSASAAASFMTSGNSSTTQTISFQPSSPFLAQLISQIPPDIEASSQLSFLFSAGRQRIVDYPTMLAFGTTRHAPSYASLPRGARVEAPAAETPSVKISTPPAIPASEASALPVRVSAATLSPAPNAALPIDTSRLADTAPAITQPITPRQASSAYRTTVERNDAELDVEPLPEHTELEIAVEGVTVTG